MYWLNFRRGKWAVWIWNPLIESDENGNRDRGFCQSRKFELTSKRTSFSIYMRGPLCRGCWNCLGYPPFGKGADFLHPRRQIGVSNKWNSEKYSGIWQRSWPVLLRAEFFFFSILANGNWYLFFFFFFCLFFFFFFFFYFFFFFFFFPMWRRLISLLRLQNSKLARGKYLCPAPGLGKCIMWVVATLPRETKKKVFLNFRNHMINAACGLAKTWPNTPVFLEDPRSGY